MKPVFLASAIAAAFAVGTPFVLAQSADTATIVAAAATTDGSTAQRAAPERRAFRSASERVEARLAYIQTALKITDVQKPQWDSFASVLRKQASDIDARMQQRRAEGAQRPAGTGLTAIQRMERTQQRMSERYHRLGEVITAAKPLYEVLSPEQKQVADTMLARGGHGGHFRHHRGPQSRGA